MDPIDSPLLSWTVFVATNMINSKQFIATPLTFSLLAASDCAFATGADQDQPARIWSTRFAIQSENFQ